MAPTEPLRPPPAAPKPGVLLAVPWLAGLALLGPVVCGGLVTVGAAADGVGLVASQAGLAVAIALTVWIGVGSTMLALGLARAIVAWAVVRQRADSWLGRAAAPVIAMPHVALAIGLGFLIAPSGWLARLLATMFDIWPRPPDWPWPGDPYGLTLIAGLAVKETAFLVFVMLAALPGCQPALRLRVAQSLGYTAPVAFARVIWPELVARIRLPILAVLAYGLSVVDVALILGPQLPPSLPVLVQRWATDPDPLWRAGAAAGAVLHVGVAGVTVAGWLALAALARRATRSWLSDGRRGTASRLPMAGGGLALLLAVVTALALAAVLTWSVAGPWRYPELLPGQITLSAWTVASPSLAMAGGSTLAIGMLTALTCLCLAALALDGERRFGRPHPMLSPLVIFVPLLVPQLFWLVGGSTLAISLGLAGSKLAVMLAQMPIVLAYVLLMLAAPWRNLDPRYEAAAAVLGAGWLRRLSRIRLPVLLPTILAALAVGFAVSVDLYLPTVLAGLGRVVTLATEQVALASGGDRRTLGALALLQALLPALALVAALRLAGPSGRRR